MRRSHSTQAQSTAPHYRLAPRESGCSCLRSKVSSDWLPNYINATRPVLVIFKMDGYFPDSPCTFETDLYLWAKPWNRRLGLRHTPLRSWVNPGQTHIGLLAMGQVYLPAFRVSPVGTFPRCFLHIHSPIHPPPTLYP